MPKKKKLPKGLRLRKDTYWYSVTVDGQQEQASCHTSDLKRAVAVLEMRRAEIHEGRYTPNRKKNTLTVQGLSDLWFSRPATEKKNSLYADVQRFAVLVELLGADRQVQTLTLADIEGLQRQLASRTKGKDEKKKPISGTTINRYFALLQSALTHASNHGHPHQNPLAGIKRAPERHKDDVFTDEQFQKLLGHAKVTADMRLVMWIGFGTGMRLGEIVNMTWDRVNLSDDVNQRGFRLLECHSKTGNPIVVPISNRLLLNLKSAKAFRPSVTVKKKGIDANRLVQLTTDNACKTFSRVAKDLGYAGTFHALRHTAITKLNDAGVDLATIMAIVGHKIPSTTLRYITVNQAKKHAAIAQVAQHSAGTSALALL